MNRRGFLSLLGMTTGGVLIDQAIPFNRVWSFPKNITIVRDTFDYSDHLAAAHQFLATHDFFVKEAMRIFIKNANFASRFKREYNPDFAFGNGTSWL